MWPTQSEVPEFFGERGKHQVRVKLPYPMRLAWAKQKIVTSISLHELVADSAGRAFKSIHKHYGDNVPEALTLFGGSLCVRKMRGGGSWSMHSWGIAIDFDPENNQLYWRHDRARLAQPQYSAFFDAWEDEGWVSLGRKCNRDWMHVQAARLG